MYPDNYNEWQIRLKDLHNLPHRHEGYDSKTFAIPYEGYWIGITMAFITHVQYEKKPFNQRMTPFTAEGRRIYQEYRRKDKPLPLNRLSINTPNDLLFSKYNKGKMNFEYYMNREYAYNRDKGNCKCCKQPLLAENMHCHHVQNKLPMDKINKVMNLAWLCIPCHRMVHNSPIPEGADHKMRKKIDKYRQQLSEQM